MVDLETGGEGEAALIRSAGGGGNGRADAAAARRRSPIAAFFADLVVWIALCLVAPVDVRAEEVPPEIRAATVTGDAGLTTVTLELSHPVAAEVFLLAGPARLVIDLPHGRFALPRDAGRKGAALIGAWRFGEAAAGRARMVFEATRPVRITRAEWIAAGFFGTDRLLVDLVPAEAEEMRAARRLTVPPPGVESPAPAEPAAAADPGASSPAAAKADRAPVVAPPPPEPRRRPIVVIDPGHGGLDAGTVSPATGTPEKTVVLALARQVVERLRASGRYEVVQTRTDDTFVGLSERVRIARAAHADLFLSIHADAEYDHSVRGATVYTLAEKATDEKAAALALKENQSDAFAGQAAEDSQDEVAGILAELTLRETRRFSNAFARDLLEEYRRWGRLVKGASHREAGLRVLRAHDIPSALVEVGFLSNKEDEALMTSPEGRSHIADSLVAAIDRWFAAHGSPAVGHDEAVVRAPDRPKGGGAGAAASP